MAKSNILHLLQPHERSVQFSTRKIVFPTLPCSFSMENKEKNTGESKARLWLKRIGVAGFLFFLIKGLIWIGVAVAIWMGLINK